MIHPPLPASPVAATATDRDFEARPDAPQSASGLAPPHEDDTPFAPLPQHLQPLSKKLTQAAIDLLAYSERSEIHLFEAVIGGQRLAIDIAVLPRVGQDSAGAMRTLPIRPELPPVAS